MTQYLSNFTQKFQPTDTFVDPVSKFRVSQPSNLTDTDFEYGLQESKWETLERVNNIPTFFSRYGDPSLDISDIVAIQGSDRITVTCNTDHNVIVGSPIIVSGLTSNSAEGAYVVIKINSDLEFEYAAKRTQSFPGLAEGATFSVKLDESTISIGKLYQGTQYKLDNLDTIQTDGKDPSQLSVQTNSPHGFVVGTKFILSNTVGGKTFKFDASLIQPQSLTEVSVSTDLPSVLDQTKSYESYYATNYDWKGKYGVFVGADDINLKQNTIYAPNHGFLHGDIVVYIAPRTFKGTLGNQDYSIGGLSNYTPYWVIYIDDNNFALTTTDTNYQLSTSSSTYITFTHHGNTDFGPHHFARGFRIVASSTTEQTLAYVNRDIENSDEVVLVSTGTGLSGVSRSTDNFNTSSWTKYYYQNTTNQTGTGYGIIEIPAANVNVNDIITSPVSLSANDFKTGDEIRFYQGGAVPGGVGNGSNYWIRVITDTTFYLYSNRANSLSGTTTSRINITSTGSDTHRIEKTRRWMRFATNPSLTAFATTNTTAPNGTTVVLPIVDLTSTTRDSIYIANHGLQTSDVVLSDVTILESGITKTRATTDGNVNDAGKIAFEGNSAQWVTGTSRATVFTGVTAGRFQNGTRVRYNLQPDYAYFLCNNANTTTDVITTEGDSRYNTLRSFKTGEAVVLDIYPESITFQLQSTSNPNADSTTFSTNSTKGYEAASVTANPVRVQYKASPGVGYSVPANTIANRELIDGNVYWFRNNSTNSSFILHTTAAGAAANTTATRVRPVTTGNGIGIITATNPLPLGLSTDTTYYIRVLSNTTFTLHATSADAIANTGRIDITQIGPSVRARVRQLEPTVLTGFVDGDDYYLRQINTTTFEFYDTRYNAMNTSSTTGRVSFPTPSLGVGNGFHQFNVIEPATLTTGRSGTTGSLLIVPDSAIFVAGQEILYTNNVLGTATATGGLAFNSKYFVRPVATTTISIHKSATGAINNTDFVTLSGAAGNGSGALIIPSVGIPTVGEGFNYVVEKLSDDRIRLKETQAATSYQALNPVPYLSGELTLTKRSPAENSETIFINEHGLSNLTELQYNSAGFTPLSIYSEFNNGYTETTLTNNENYYVVSPSQNRFRLARTSNTLAYNFTASSGTIDTTAFTVTVGSNHGIRTGDTVLYESVNPITGAISGAVYYALRMRDSIISFNNATAWNTGSDLVTVTHGYGANGTIIPVVYRTAEYQGASSTGNAAGGLTLEGLYWAKVLSATTLEFYPTNADAVAGTNKIDITAQGTGTGYLERSNRIALFYGIRDLYDNQVGALTIDPITTAGTYPLDTRVPLLSFNNGTQHKITKYDIVDFVSAGEAGEQELGNVLPNAVDGIYTLESVVGDTSSKKFLLSPTNAILSPRTLTFDPREALTLEHGMFNFDSHSLYDRAPVIYNPDREIEVGQVYWIAPDPDPAVDTNERAFVNVTHGIAEATRARYESETPVYPLTNNGIYYVNALTETSFAVYDTEADAIADTNRIQLDDNGGAVPIEGTGIFYAESLITPLEGLENNTTYYVIRKSADFISLATNITNAETKTNIEILDAGVPGELHTIKTFNVAAEVEGLGTVGTTSDSNIITGDGTSFFNLFKIGDILKISVPRANVTKTLTQNTTNMTAGGVITVTTHGFATGQAVRYASTTPVNELTPGFIYYVRILSANTFTLHPSVVDAEANTGIITISGTPTGTGSFTTVYPGTVFESKITGIKTDTSLILDTPIPAINDDIASTPIGTQIGLKYLIGSTLYVKGDGFALHRPFDGGVELTPSLNPDSQITRQTRKYFRYQSGKGIQVSFGINFNAPVQIDAMSVNSAAVATIKTRYPNRITEGLTLDIVKAEDNLSQPPRLIDDSNASVDLVNNTLVFASPHLYNNGLGVLFESEAPLGGLNSGTVYYVRVNQDSPETAIEFYSTLDGALLNNQSTRITLDDSPISAILTPENPWNGRYEVIEVVDEREFKVQLSSQPPSPFAQGFSQYTPVAWSNSYLRAGMFDDQNGMYFEYDGHDLYVCKRSSTNQLSGTVEARFNSGEILGTGTIFLSQIDVGDRIAIRGQTYKVVNVSSNTVLHVQPPYSGESKANIIVSKIEEVRVPQSQWNLDKADGNGPSGFNLDLTKMQMAYMDYSWYGAGKVRFGFKGVNGDVNYFHQMVHNNLETEAYLRSGNLPTRYEVENKATPSYSPTIAHWGTSVIMDGGFDDDKAYQFNAASRTLAYTNTADQLSFSGTIPSLSPSFITDPDTGTTAVVYRIFSTTWSTIQNIRNNTTISGAQLQSGTTTVGTPTRSGNGGYVYIDKIPAAVQTTATTYNYGPGADLVPLIIPLVSVRLGPAVDNGFVGKIGVRDIINRMQLSLKQVGIITTHDVNVKLLLNPNIDNITYSSVEKPSLSQLINHSKGDTVSNGVEVFNFRANGNSTTTSSVANTTVQTLGDVFELGNSILGGDGTFPDGPDILTVAVAPLDLSLVSDVTPFRVSASITWTESQA